MVTTTGPAVGAKAQMGFSEESKWGCPKSPPTTFIEFTSEGVVSDFTTLVSAALRSDRAVHKQRLGTEAAGGDINFEVGPEGLGTWMKHALGKKRTKRTDIAFIIVYTGTASDVTISLDTTSITSTGADTELAENITVDTSTCDTLITAIGAVADWECYAPWGDGSTGYFGVIDKTTAAVATGAEDYGYGATNYVETTLGGLLLETITAMPIGIAGADEKVFFPVSFKYGIYEHTIDTGPDLPEVTEGMTIEVGRDVAAFNYYGSKVNTFTLNATPGEFVTGTMGIMSKGASTNGNPAADATNTGWNWPIFGLKYLGSSASCKIAVDTTADVFYMEEGAAASEVAKWWFSLERGYFDHEGYYYNVQTIGGLVEFLRNCNSGGDFDLIRHPAVDYTHTSADLKDLDTVAAPGALSATTETQIDIIATEDANAVPLIRGDYIGTDAGSSATIYVKITGAGVPDGTADFGGSTDGTNYSTDIPITYGIWYDILDGDDTDTGFDVMFPNNESLVADDQWSFTTFKDEQTGATFSTTELLVGAQGSVTMDGVEQAVMGLSATLTNNLFGDKYELGDKQRKALKEQQYTVEGTITVEFDDLDLYRKFVNGVAGNLVFIFTGDDYINGSTTFYSMQVRYPNMKFNGTTPVAAGPEIITTDFPIVGLYDDVNSIPSLRIVLTNNQGYI